MPPIIVPGTRNIDSIPVLFEDVNALVSVFNSLTDNYRLLVGAAEELTRTPGASQQAVNLALERVYNTGSLIDITLLALAVKLDFVAEVLAVTGIPLNLLIAALALFLADDPSQTTNLANPGASRFTPQTAGGNPQILAKWDKRKKQWEARQKKWEARKMFCKRKY